MSRSLLASCLAVAGLLAPALSAPAGAAEQQVLLRVTVAEVNALAARTVGIRPSGTNQECLIDDGPIQVGLRALRALGCARSLAEPNLVTIDNQTASFQVGGLFPVPMAQGKDIAFEPVGVQVAFTPRITGQNRVCLAVEGSISDRDLSVPLEEGTVPALETKSFRTTAELREGQTLILAGLAPSNQSGERVQVVLVTPEVIKPAEPQAAAASPLPSFPVEPVKNGKEVKHQLVEQLLKGFHVLFKEGKYNEAEGLALFAQAVDPNNAVASSAVYIARRQQAGMSAAEVVKDEKRIEEKLRTPVNVSFNDVPLKAALDEVSQMSGMNIVVNVPALQEEGISLESPVSIKLNQVSLKSALNLILHQVHLTYVIKDEVLQVTSEAHARGKPVTVTHQVADLTAPAQGEETTEESLIKLITSTVAPRSWAEMGGPGTIDYHPLSGSLVINQTPDVQEQILDLLAALRRLKEAQQEAVTAKVAKLLARYEKACAEGDAVRAKKLAGKALELDPTCFRKGKGD